MTDLADKAETQKEEVVHTSNTQSQESLGNGSSHWSVPTLSHTGQGDSYAYSIIENDNGKGKDGKCWSVRKLLQFLFHWKKTGIPASVDKFQLIADLTNYINLMDAFIKLYLTPKLEAYLKEIYFSKACGNLCLPAAQVWTATYLLNQHMKPFMDAEPESVELKKIKAFRRLLLSLCWEMEVAKKVSYQFYTRFQKFSNDLNYAFKKLRSTLISVTGSKETLEFHTKKNLELNLKKDRVPIILDIKSNASQNFPFSLSVDTKSIINNDVVARNQDFLKLKSEVQEEIITSFLNSAVLSLETCYSILESSHERISSRGIIKKEENNDYRKDLTCYNALRCMSSLIVQLASAKLEESEITYLYTSISGLLDKWNEYVGFAQEVILSFYELSDMITICYSFARHEIKLPIPDLVSVQKEVSVKSKFQTKTEKSRSTQLDLKEYAVEALLEECVERQNSDSSIGNAKSSVLKIPLAKENSICCPYHNAMLSTRYPLFIQQYPLEVLSKRGHKYSIVFRLISLKEIIILQLRSPDRPVPDLERIDSDMMLSEHTTVIASTKVPTSHNNTKLFKCLQLETFKKLEIQVND